MNQIDSKKANKKFWIVINNSKFVVLPSNNIPIFTSEQYEDGRYFEGMMVNGIK